MQKKIAYVLLAVIMLVVTACSNAGTPTQTDDNQEVETNPGGGEAVTQPEQPVSFSWSLPATSNAGYHGTITDWENEKWLNKLEELSNTDITLQITEVARMSIMFAGGDIPDVVGSFDGPTGNSMSGSVESGIFMPLDDLLREHAPNLMANVPQAAWDAVSYDGKIYGIPDYLVNPSRRATFIRTDLLEQTGLDVPKTVDEFIDVLRAFKELGVEFPYQMRQDFKYSDTFFGAYDVLSYKDQFEVVDGRVQPKFFDVENMKLAIQAYKTLYDEGLIPKDFPSTSGSDFDQNIRGGKAGAWTHNAAGLAGYRTAITQVDPNAKVDIIPSPVGPEGMGGYFFYSPVVRSFYINNNVSEEKAIGIIKFFDWMQSEEAELFFTFGIEGEHYTVDSSGNITITAADTPEFTQELTFLNAYLWSGKDATYNPPVRRLVMSENGQDTLTAFEEILDNEGLPGIGFYPELEAFTRYPDLAPSQPDVGPKLINDYIVQMVFGVMDIEEWPKVIEEYLARGGEEILAEANERYQNNEGVLDLRR